MSNWPGIMKIKEISKISVDGDVLWKFENIKNILHLEGEEYLLQAAFVGGRNSTIIPDFYYIGLDNRTSISAENAMDDLIEEPIGGGYERIEISSTGDFNLNFEFNHYVVTSPIVAFRADTGSWGPCRNVFLTAEVNGDFKLISSVVLPSPIIMNFGESITMRIGMQIREC